MSKTKKKKGGPTFKAKINSVKIFRKILDGVRDLVKDLNIDISPGGVNLEKMDTSHVSLIHLFLHKDFFESYKCKKNLSLGVNMMVMTKILKCSNQNDSMTLVADEDSDDLKFIFESEDGLTSSEFYMKLSEIDADELQVPEVEYSSIIRMGSANFKKMCNNTINLGDSITIKVEGKKATFDVNGESGSGSIVISDTKGVVKKKKKKKKKKKGEDDVEDEELDDEDEEDNGIKITSKEPVQLTFALKYLNFFCKSASLNKNVFLKVEEENPLMVEFALEGESFLRFYLAPKIDDIENDDDNDDNDDGIDDDDDDEII